MKIIHIFAGKIYSFQFDNETENELRRNMNLWNNEQYIHQFLKENQNDIPGNSTNERIAKLIHEDSYELSASLYQVATDDNHLKLYLSNLTTRNINTHYCHHEKQGETI